MKSLVLAGLFLIAALRAGAEAAPKLPAVSPPRPVVEGDSPSFAAVAAPKLVLPIPFAPALRERGEVDPPAVGVTRHLDRELSVSGTANDLFTQGGALRSTGSFIVWGAQMESVGAAAVRVHFDKMKLPAGAKVFVFGANGEFHGPYMHENSAAQDFWSNTVNSDHVWVEVSVPVPSGPVDVSIDSIAHLESAEYPESVDNPACLVDVNCAGQSQIRDWLSSASARLLYQSSGTWYVCTGTILSDRDDTFTPFMLTANHCIPDQATASTLQATFRYKTSYCGGVTPDDRTLPTTIGATLLATSTTNDFAFLRLAGTLPGGVAFMGWNPRSDGVFAGQSLYRVSQPLGGPQKFSTHSVSSSPTPGACTNRPVTSYIYSKAAYGGTAGGSSGSAISTVEGWVVGQQMGWCGQSQDNCDNVLNSTLDGRFSETYPAIRHWLENESSNPPCATSNNTLCMQSNRFAVTFYARDPRSGATDSGLVMNSTNVFGYFAFAGLGSTTDPQIFVKVIDGRPVNNKWWVFYSALTDVEFTITVKDTSTNTTRTYHKDPYVNGAAGADLNAF